MLTVKEASVFFESRDKRLIHALDNVSLDIPDGAMVVALGASGCGKSTLLNAMAGFLPLSSGAIFLNGKPVLAPGADKGVVFQRDTLLPWLSVIDNVSLGLKYAGTPRKERNDRAHALLDLVGLSDFSRAAPYELSGGMRQRISLARALAPEPAILLMDEPFGALDSRIREQMQELLASVWKRTGKQIFFITHSIEEALFLGTQVIVMSPRPGRVVARFDLNFVHQYAQGHDSRTIKKSREFSALREEIREIIHSSESELTS